MPTERPSQYWLVNCTIAAAKELLLLSAAVHLTMMHA
jgi:hypothetical protein